MDLILDRFFCVIQSYNRPNRFLYIPSDRKSDAHVYYVVQLPSSYEQIHDLEYMSDSA